MQPLSGILRVPDDDVLIQILFKGYSLLPQKIGDFPHCLKSLPHRILHETGCENTAAKDWEQQRQSCSQHFDWVIAGGNGYHCLENGRTEVNKKMRFRR
jgi:hypothetical protein